ncbi:MAG: hypothetical protein ACPGQL_05885 [Thermoplasmatota archaeon]
MAFAKFTGLPLGSRLSFAVGVAVLGLFFTLVLMRPAATFSLRDDPEGEDGEEEKIED